MKRINIIALCAMTMLGLASCELKDELSGDKGQKAGSGTLELGVATKVPSAVTRTVDAAAADFPVTITNSSDEVVASYDRADAMPSSIKLTVDSYTVDAHTPGTLVRTMSAPYYAGSLDFTVIKDVTTTRNLVCTMQNSYIKLNYDPTFLENFSTWTVTIDDGGQNALEFTHKDTDPAPVYLLFGENVKTINVNIKAETIKGETVSASFALTKADAIESYDSDNIYFTGGDALTFTLTPTETLQGSVSGLTLTVEALFQDGDNEIWTIYVDDVVLEPDDDGDNNEDETPIVISEPKGTSYLTDGISWTTGDSYPDVLIQMDFTNGLKSVYVMAQTTDEDFKNAIGVMGNGAMLQEPGLDLTSDTAQELADLFDLPKVGDKQYNFSLKEAIFTLLAEDPGYNGTHSFILKAVDSKNNSATATLTIHITKITSSEEGGE